MSRIPYEITVRDPEGFGSLPGEHEVVFTRHFDTKMSTGNVLSLNDEELMALYEAVRERLFG